MLLIISGDLQLSIEKEIGITLVKGSFMLN